VRIVDFGMGNALSLGFGDKKRTTPVVVFGGRWGICVKNVTFILRSIFG